MNIRNYRIRRDKGLVKIEKIDDQNYVWKTVIFDPELGNSIEQPPELFTVDMLKNKKREMEEFIAEIDAIIEDLRKASPASSADKEELLGVE